MFVDSETNSAPSIGVRIATRFHEPAAVERVVTRLREIERESGIERTLAIGELILRQFFGGDPETWRDRRRNKNNSIRRIAAHAECPFSKSALNDAVGVYVATLKSPCVRTFGHIGSSHVAAVLNLDAVERERVLREADRARWSVRQLRENVVQMRRAEGERRGRPATNNQARTLRLLSASVRLLSDAVAELRSASSVTPDAQADLAPLARNVARLTSELQALLGPTRDATCEPGREP